MYTYTQDLMEVAGYMPVIGYVPEDKLSPRTRRNQRHARTARRKQIRRRQRRQARTGKKLRVVALLLVVLATLVFTGASRQGYLPGGPESLSGNGCPKALVQLAERQPEASEFVRDYSSHRGETYDPEAVDISADVAAGGIPHFLQWDERWGYAKYGSSYLAVTGCGPTCLAMVYCGRTGSTEWNPLKMARFAEDHGYYTRRAGTSWDLMSEGAEQLGLSSYAEYPCEENITAALARGDTIICSVMAGDFTTSGHFIVLAGLDEQGKVIVRDPNSKARSEQTWDAQRIADQCAEMWVYE